MKKLLKSLVFALIPPLALAGEVVITDFGGGLNSQDLPAVIAPNESPDLFNIDLDPTGKSFGSRDGYGLYKTLPISQSTAAVHGGHVFQDSTGNSIQLWANAEEVASIVAGGTPVKISTITSYATMDCANSQGNAYCLNSARDTGIRTDGTVSGTSFQGGIPKGTMAEFTPIRLAVAGVSGTPNTIYFSRSNAFTDFTTGITDPDPFTEVIASPGSRLTHIRYACGKLLWWKDQSFGWLAGDTQSDITVQIVQSDIGTLDNSSAYYNNTVWFRGQDAHLYAYDCAGLVRLSKKITPTVGATGRRIANSWTQSSQSDFASGRITPNAPSLALSTASIAGSVVVSSFVAIDSGPVQFTQGSGTNIHFSSYSVRLSTNNAGTVSDNSFESSSGSNFSSNWSTTSDLSCSGSTCVTVDNNFLGGHVCGTVGAKDGSYAARLTSLSDFTMVAEALSLDNSIVYSSTTFAYIRGLCTWTQKTISVPFSNSGKRFRLRFRNTTSNNSFQSTSTYVLGGDITFWVISDETGGANARNVWVDLVEGGSSTITSGNFRSRVFDTAMDSTTIQMQALWSANNSTPILELQSATSSGGPWSPVITSTGTNSKGRRYLRYVSSFTISGDQNALTDLTSASVLATSSGTYYSAVNNAPNLTQWEGFLVGETLNDGTINYFTRSSTNSFTVLSSTPSWTAQTKNANVAVSTGTYFQLRSDFAITSATQTPTLNDFTFSWFEGAAADKAYIEYFDDHVWFAVSSGTTGLNNRVLRWDLRNNAWLVDGIASNGFVVDQGRMYFGDSSGPYVYLFGDVSTDNGSSITSYWSSKSFTGDDPFLVNEPKDYDWLVASSTGSLSVNYQNSASSGTYSLNLYSPTTSLLRRSDNMPPGRIGNFYSVRIGNTSSNPYEVFGHRMRYVPLNWKPQ